MNSFLTDAKKNKSLVTLTLNKKYDPFRGYVLDFNEELILLKDNATDFEMDGYRIVRAKYVTDFESSEYDEFLDMGIKLKKQGPLKKETVPLKPLAEMLLFLNKYGAFHFSQADLEEGYIGRVDEIHGKNMMLQPLSTMAEFLPVKTFKIDSIRSIEFDTDYVNTLVRLNKKLFKKSK